jgi:hypothetical protein
MDNKTKLIVCWLLVSLIWLVIIFIINRRRGPDLSEIICPIFGSGFILLLVYLANKYIVQ